jgi:hypothetical protein
VEMIKSRNKKGLLEYYLADQPKSTSKQKSRLEKYEQLDLNFHCKAQFPDEYDAMFHVVNESGGAKSGAAKKYQEDLKKRGRKSGVPDWHVMVPAHGYHGLYIELKREFKKDSSLPKPECEFLLMQQSRGYCCIVAYGFRAALIAIKDYLTDELN